MKEVTISIPKEKTEEITQFLENEIKINSIIFLTGQNCNQFIIYLPQNKVGNLLNKLDQIGCGVTWGLIKVSNINALKPTPKETNNLSYRPGGTLSLEQVYSLIVSGVSFTKDFVAYTIISSLIASLGLASDSVVMIIASMLLSPIMIPLLGIALGLVIQDYFLLKKALKTELLSWLIIFLVSFISSIPLGNFSNELEWPTEEMNNRGRTRDVIMGILFAIPSGFAVGLSVTTGGINNFVGVAVAAALVPVLSNAGLLLGHALMEEIYLGGDNYGTNYSQLGGKSLAIFILNVLLIALSGIGVFFLKDIKKFRRTSINWKFPKITHPTEKIANQTLVDKFMPEVRPNLKLQIDSDVSEYTEKEIQELLNGDPRIKNILKKFFLNQRELIRKTLDDYPNSPTLKKLKKNLQASFRKELE